MHNTNYLLFATNFMLTRMEYILSWSLAASPSFTALLVFQDYRNIVRIKNITPNINIVKILKYKAGMISGSSKPPAPIPSTLVTDVQYQLSKCFMNYARDQLLNKQLALMMETNLLLETLTTRVTSKNNDRFDKDFCNVITSQTLDTLNDEDDIPKAKSRLFTRKTTHVPPPRLLNSSSHMGDALEEIRDHCSVKTFTTVSNLIENYNKLKKTPNQTKPQLNTTVNGIIRSRPDTDRPNNDQSLILTARILKIQKENSILNQKIKDLEGKLAKASSNKSKQPVDNTKTYYEDQLKQIKTCQQKIKVYHQKIVGSLQEKIIEQGCNRCCVLVKKVKDSLINYKECLIGEIQTYRTLWQKLNGHANNQQSQISEKVQNQR